MVQVEALPEPLEELLDDELEELDEELLELEELRPELEEDELEELEELEDELELDELELEGIGSAPHAASNEDNIRGLAHLPRIFLTLFMMITKCID